jgi:hypothetical protein
MAQGTPTPGRRLPDNSPGRDHQPGDYSLQTWTKPPQWWVRDPAGALRSLGPGHAVLVHADGSITVRPSILDPKPGGWHGWLEHGSWREA